MTGTDVRAITQPHLTVWSSIDLGDPTKVACQWRCERSQLYTALVKQLRGCRTLINAAGRADPDGSDETELLMANAVLPVVLALAARDAGVQRLVHISSAVVQGRMPLTVHLEYQSLSPYARSKVAGERAVLALGAAGPDQVVIYRPPSVIAASRLTAAGLRRIARLPVVPVLRADAPVPTALLKNVGSFARHLATVATPAPVYVHPSEGMTVRSLIQSASGERAPAIIDLAWLDGVGERAFAAACRLERVAPRVRRIELLLRGQKQINAGPTAGAYGWFLGPEEYSRQLGGTRRPSDLIKIAFVITRSDTIGGAAVHVADMSAALASAGHEVRVFLGGEGPYTEILKTRGIGYHPVKGLGRDLTIGGDLAALRGLRGALRAFRPDLVSTHSSKAGVLGRLVARSLGMPVVFTAHGWAFAEGVDEHRRRIYAATERVMARLTSAIVCVSTADLRLAESFNVGSSVNRYLIRNGVRDVSEAWRADPGGEPVHAVMVARLDDQKDYQTLFASLTELSESLRVSLVGDGPDEGILRARHRELGLSGVSFLGRRQDVHRILSEAQMLLLISNWEGLPRSIIEAMRAGLPVVASDVGGVRELVDDERTGMLVGRKHVRALTEALKRLQADPALRVSMGAAGRAKYEAEFKLARLVNQTVAVYEDLLGREVRRPTNPSVLVIE